MDPSSLPRPTPRADLFERVRDLADAFGVSPRRIALIAASVFALLGIAFAVGVSAMKADNHSSVPTIAMSPSSTVATIDLTVDVGGAVQRPGVYTLKANARVTDAIAAAGGLLGNADSKQLNLAAKVADGQKVFVPAVGEAPPAIASGVAGTAEAKIDLNTATEQQLDELPGVGPATAQAILEYRNKHARFKTVDELLEVPGIGDAKLEKIRSKIQV